MKLGGVKCHILAYIIFSFILNLTWVSQVFCYDTNIAHPGIAEMAVKLYNKNSDNKISVEQLNWIKQGAQAEDVPTRWLNHFYDPVYNRGLNFLGQHVTAKEWSKNFQEQTNYALGDRSWPRALSDYRKGDYKDAFKELGQNIHLVSDVLVPAHTREDIHAVPPDSYEQYVKNNWTTLSKDLKSEITDKNSLDDIFDEAANYSNSNFYSDDTIEDKKYKINKVVSLKPYSFNKNTNLFVAQIINSDGNIVDSYLTEGSDWKKDNKNKTVNDSIVLSSYAKDLLPKAVGYSANVIKLFFNEAKNNQTDKLPLFRVGLNGIANYLAGTAVTVAENFYNSVNAQQPQAKIIASANDSISNSVVENPQILDGDLVNNKPQIKTVIKSNNLSTSPQNEVTVDKALGPISSTQPIIPVLDSHNVPIGGDSDSYYYSGGSSQTVSTKVVSQLVVETSSSPAYVVSTTIIVNDIILPTSTSQNLSIVTSSVVVSSTDIIYTTSTVEEVVSSTIIASTTQEIFSTSTISDTSSISFLTTSSVDLITSSTDDLLLLVTSTEDIVVVTSSPSSSLVIPDVVINEVAWAGTSAVTDQDEYIELFNNTNHDINLFPSGEVSKWWKIIIGDKEISLSKIVNPIIPKNGYYLLERTDDRTVNEIPADVIYSGVLKNSGEKIILIDGAGQLVDELDNSSGWFAGSDVSYASMERMSSRKPSSDDKNWQTNQGPRLIGKVDGGGDDIPLRGSPKQPNFGPIVLKSKQLEDHRVLKKSNFPYILTYYEIPVGKKLTVDPGVVIKTYYPDSKIVVNGYLDINGADNDKVIITSGRDKNLSGDNFDEVFGVRNEPAQSKDWQGMVFNPYSLDNITGLEMRYAGKDFKIPGSNMWDSLVSHSIHADNAVINIKDSVFNDNGDTVIFLQNSTSSINNTILNNGNLAIENYGGELKLNDVSFGGFSNSNGPVYIKNIWPEYASINFNQNSKDVLFIDQAIIKSDIDIDTKTPLLLKDITIDDDVKVDVEAGVTIELPRYANFFVKGTLNLNGDKNNPINLVGSEPLDNYNYWGRLIFDGGHGNFKSSNISGGWGSIATYDSFQGMIVVKNGDLNLDDCQLLNSRPPGNSLEIDGSSVTIKNSTIGYLGSKPNFDNTNGIKINSGDLTLDNTNLLNLDTGLVSGNTIDLPNLKLNNMDIRNFINVGKFWDPSIWYIDFISTSTSPAG